MIVPQKSSYLVAKEAMRTSSYPPASPSPITTTAAVLPDVEVVEAEPVVVRVLEVGRLRLDDQVLFFDFLNNVDWTLTEKKLTLF